VRKPVFTTVNQLRPQMHGHTLVVCVVSAHTIIDKSSMHIGRTCIAKCLVGYNTDTVLITPATIRVCNGSRLRS
jgi:replication factor A1